MNKLITDILQCLILFVAELWCGSQVVRLGDRLINILKVESYVHTLGLSFKNV